MSSSSAGPFIWVGPRGGDADCVAWAGRPAGIVCCDWSPELAAADIPIASLERDSGVRALFSSADADGLAAALPGVVKAVGGRPSLFMYRTTAELGRIARTLGLAVYPAMLGGPLEDKIAGRRFLNALGVPTPAWTTVASLDNIPLSWAERRCVIQARLSSLGRGTLRLESVLAGGQGAELLGASPWLISEWIEGPILNVNAVASAKGVFVGFPSVQIVDDSEPLQPFRYGGNDFTAAASLPPSHLRAAVDITRTIGLGLAAQGLCGPFGVDLCAGRTAVVTLEVNLRCQGSTSQMTRLESAAGIVPTLSGWTSMSAGLAARDPLAHPLAGMEIIRYSNAEFRWSAEFRKMRKRRGEPVQGTLVRPGAALFREEVETGVSCSVLDDR